MIAALELADPRGLWALALALPLVVLHLYRKRRRRLEVAFVPLLRESVGATQAFGWFRRIADVVALALRLLALACLALALSGPRPAGAATPPEDLVLVIDADATALALESRIPQVEWRFDRSISLAKAHVRAHVGGRIAVVVGDATPRIAMPLTEDRGAAVKALHAFRPTGGTTDLSAAIAAARAIPAGSRPIRTLVISSRPAPKGTPSSVEFEGAGTVSDDQGFVDQSVLPAADGVRWAVSLAIHNFSSASRTRRLVARWRDRGPTPHAEEVALEPRSSKEVRFEVLPPRGGDLLVARLEGEDAFTLNDVTAAFLTPFSRPTVLVVHGGTPRAFVTALLDAMGDQIDREASGAVLAADLPKASPRDVTIVDGVGIPPGAVKRGAWIFLAPFPEGAASDRLPFTVGKAVNQPLVWRVDASNPLLRGVDLSTAFVARGSAIGGEGSRGLGFAEGEAVVAEGEKEGVRWMAFGLDPDGSDLPIRAALPVLLRNAIRRLAVAPAQPLKPFYRAGEEVRPRVSSPALAEAPFYRTRDLEGHLHGPMDREIEAIPSFRAAGAWPTAGLGGTWLMTLEARVGSEPDPAWTATVDLDPSRDITPARPTAVPPPPVPPTSSEDEIAARWRRWLLIAAGALLLLDIASILGGARKVARPLVRA